MSTQWYYTSQDKELGPVSLEELKKLADSGQLRRDDMVWQEGWEQWQPASGVEDLFDPGEAAPPEPVAVQPGPSPRRRSGTPNSGGTSRSLTAAGAILLLLSLFVPWWCMSIEIDVTDFDPRDPEEYLEDGKSAGKVLARNLNWYIVQNVHGRAIVEVIDLIPDPEDMEDMDEPPDIDISIWLWGWNTTTGIMVFVFATVILPVVLTTLFVPALRPWSWGFSYVTGILGFISLVFSVLWVLGAPQANVDPYLSQANIVGPYMILVGSLLVLAGSLIDVITGMQALLKRLPAS